MTYKILNIPFLWNTVQNFFGCVRPKGILYRSVFPRTGRILDFGCALGNTFFAFTDFEYYGVDINSRFIDYAKRKYSHFKNAHFICADILKRPFASEYFDFILFAATGHHLSDEELIKIMRALGEMLKTGGSIYFFDNIYNPAEDSLPLKLVMRIDQGKFTRDLNRYNVMVHQFSERLTPIVTRTFNITGNWLLRYTHFYAELKKR